MLKAMSDDRTIGRLEGKRRARTPPSLVWSGSMHAVFTSADAYDRFMGRYSQHLAPQMADLGGVTTGTRAVDVGCGPGALTAELVRRAGASAVAAADPSDAFVAAVRTRYPGVDARVASAESLPFESGTCDASLAQLVVHFMKDPVRGLREMARVTRRAGTVVACVWDNLDRGPIAPFSRAAREMGLPVDDESKRPGVRKGHLAELFREAGLRDVESSELWVHLEHPSFESWWGPFELGVGPAGLLMSRLSAEQRNELKERARGLMPQGAFTHDVRAWAARGTV